MNERFLETVLVELLEELFTVYKLISSDVVKSGTPQVGFPGVRMVKATGQQPVLYVM